MNKNLVTLHQPESYITERYKLFRTHVNYASEDSSKQVIMVTSSSGSEGKSITAGNLAISFAREDKKVLLIDGHIRSPHIHKLFSKSLEPGLSNLFIDKLDIDEILQPTEDIMGLDLITAGPTMPFITEIFDTKCFKTLVEEARQSYDIILLDMPPLLNLTDAVITSRLVDGVILVVASHQSKMADVREAKNVLERVGANILGVAFTKTKGKHSISLLRRLLSLFSRKKRPMK